MTVDSSGRTVSAVEVSGATVTLTLASAVKAAETVTVSYAAGTNPIQDASGNDAAGLTDQAVTNNIGAVSLTDRGEGCAACPDAPTGFARPGPGHGQITVSWTPATSGGSATSWTLSSPKQGFGGTLLTLSASARSHTFSNLEAGAAYDVRVQGVNGSGNGDSGQANGVVALDTEPPSLSGAAVNGTALTLTYNENLDAGSVPAAGDFTVTVDGSGRTVSMVEVSEATITLTLASAVRAAETVTVSYAAGTNPIQDASGNDAAGLTDRAVTNNTGAVRLADIGGGCAACPDAPTGSARPGPGHGQITVSWTPATTGVAATDWGVRIRKTGTSMFTATTVAASARSHTFSDLEAGVAYDVQVIGRKGTQLGNVTQASGVAALDTEGPVLSGAVVDGAALTLTYNENLDTASVPAAGDFTVTVAGSGRTVSAVRVSGATITLTLASAVTVSYAAGTNPVQDASGNDAAGLTNRAVTNNTGAVSLADTGGSSCATCPAPTGVAVSGPGNGQITVSWTPATTGASATGWGLRIEKTGTLFAGEFTFLGAGARSHTFSDLEPGAAYDLQVIGTFVVGGTLRGGDVAQANGVVALDAQGPVFSSAVVDGASLTLTFGEDLDAGSVPAAGDFAVFVAGSERTVSTVMISEATITLTLASAVTAGQTVTVSYAAGMNPVRDAAGNDAAGLTNRAVTNNTGTVGLADTGGSSCATCPDAPTGSARPGPGHGQITVNWFPATTGATVDSWFILFAKQGGTFTSVSLAGSARSHTLSNLEPGVAYTVQVIEHKDGAGSGDRAQANGVVALDTQAPVLSSAAVDGATLTLTYGENLDAGSVPAAGDFTVTVAGSGRAVSTVEVNGDTVTLTLASAVTLGQTVTVSYTAGTNPVQDRSGNDAANLTGQTVTNNTS